MKTVEIKIDEDNIIQLVYDDTLYEIEYNSEDINPKYNNSITCSFYLRRLSDGKVIKKFFGRDNKSIIQCGDHFAVIKKKDHGYRLTNYSDNGGEKLEKIEYNEANCCRHIRDDIFFLGADNDRGLVYKVNNPYKMSKIYSKVYTDDSIYEIMHDDTVLVSEEKFSKHDREMKDTITYGIDPVTYEIKTPIWSDLQQRYIPIMSLEECLKKEKEINKGDTSIIIDSLANRTIEIEVQHALDVIALMLKKYDAHLNGALSEADKKFVKGFNVDVYL